MPVIPPPPPVTIAIDGTRLQQYVKAYAQNGRVYAPVAPLLRRLADTAWWDGSTLVVSRAGRELRVRVPSANWASPQTTFFEVAPVLRFLGDSVNYNVRRHELDVRTPAASPVSTPTPYRPVQQTPRNVFTPTPPVTPRPRWTGSPLPRRTPLNSLGSPPLKIRRSG
ncbi:MAG TPA: hypothetical protein VGF18_09615 [Candidatus Tumulicola sp.]